MSLCTHTEEFLGTYTQQWNVWAYGMHNFSFTQVLPKDSESECTHLHSHQQKVMGTFSSDAYQYMILLDTVFLSN